MFIGENGIIILGIHALTISQFSFRLSVCSCFIEYIFNCAIGWKLGWSKAPKDEKCCKVIVKSYEIESTSRVEDDEVFDNEDIRPDDDDDDVDDEAVDYDEESTDKIAQEDDFQDAPDRESQKRTLRDANTSALMNKSGSSDNFVENA